MTSLQGSGSRITVEEEDGENYDDSKQEEYGKENLGGWEVSQEGEEAKSEEK